MTIIDQMKKVLSKQCDVRNFKSGDNAYLVNCTERVTDTGLVLEEARLTQITVHCISINIDDPYKWEVIEIGGCIIACVFGPQHFNDVTIGDFIYTNLFLSKDKLRAQIAFQRLSTMILDQWKDVE